METEIAGPILSLNAFLIDAPNKFNSEQETDDLHPHRIIHRYKLDDVYISCIRYSDDFFITGPDIYKIISFKVRKLGRIITDKRKFNEGISSDLRNLKIGIDSVIEYNGSTLLDLLVRFGALRTLKKQKLFKWHSVPHDRMFLDALERDLKREAAGTPGTSTAIDPASFALRYDRDVSLKQQFYDQGLADIFLLRINNGSEFYKQGKSLKKLLQKRSAVRNEKDDISLLNEIDNINLSEKRAFKCDICDKAFKRDEHLRRHKRSHTKERPYVCEICHKSFTRSDNLAVHFRTHNSNVSKPVMYTDSSDAYSECSSTYMSSIASSDSASHYSSRPSTATHWTDSPNNILDHQVLLPFSQSYEPSSGPMRRHRSETPSCLNLNGNSSFYGSSLPTYSMTTYDPIENPTERLDLDYNYAVPRTAQSLPSFDDNRLQPLPYTVETHAIPTMVGDICEDDFRTPTESQFAYQPPPIPMDNIKTPTESQFRYQVPSVNIENNQGMINQPEPTYLPYQYYNTYDGFQSV
ncbi:hypothetical protein E3Q24_02398 [Wallemia mellicola]|uniref:STE-domain-containing protein n=1 Tax=Wallemia mellicola TaxID=1708541 RepID=A0AB74KEW7_9BASI|nr:hypothetical protein E3Q24_02398 [Wallemia mellicola]TIC10911.1 STE-domain-containing protein [Wallemia mellicola]TIC16414.1 STE-domain-containing protein [Wallemia mellicola]TIC34820.1 STE-domain-containing protein [Wallemia mellicola]TIC54501.1 STE-domain-containing protein [Wallemia mellicola]